MSRKYLYTKIQLELLWWLFTGLVLTILYLPLLIHDIRFPFLGYNAFFVISAISITRWIFQLRHSFIAYSLPLKFLLMFASVVIIMLSYRGISLLNIYNDENGYYALFNHLDLNTRYRMAAYVNWEFMFFGIAASLAALLFPFRLLVSIWRVKNRGTE